MSRTISSIQSFCANLEFPRSSPRGCCNRLSLLFTCSVVLVAFASPHVIHAQQNWHANVGAQSGDMGKQALAFLPNEIWIHAGDSITWTFKSDEIHTLTFLTPGQVFPSFQAGCPGFSSSGASFDGSTCVTTPTLVKGQTFEVTFPTAGNFKFDCLVHNTMTGAIHVLNPSALLPHDQDFYDDQAAAQSKVLFAETDQKMSMNQDGDHDDGFSVEIIPREKHVIAGIGLISSTPGGLQTSSVERFLNGNLTIHAGDTIEWSNHDPEEPHTITFGQEPMDTFDPSPNVTVDPDGALHATIASSHDNVHSGFIEQALEDEPGLPSNLLAANPTRFRITFTQAGTYKYKCALHDTLGMVGKVIVLP